MVYHLCHQNNWPYLEFLTDITALSGIFVKNWHTLFGIFSWKYDPNSWHTPMYSSYGSSPPRAFQVPDRNKGPERFFRIRFMMLWDYVIDFLCLQLCYGPKKLDIFLLCYMGKWAGRHSFANQHGCRKINVWRFSKLWIAVTLAFFGISTRNLQRPFKKGLFTSFENFVRKIVNLNFWWRHRKPRIHVLLTGWCFYTGRCRALGPSHARPNLGFVSARIEISARQ